MYDFILTILNVPKYINVKMGSRGMILFLFKRYNFVKISQANGLYLLMESFFIFEEFIYRKRRRQAEKVIFI